MNTLFHADTTLFSSVAKPGWALQNVSHVSAIRLANDSRLPLHRSSQLTRNTYPRLVCYNH
eukprot:4300733-Pleurochrysis_carterae.AAC.1